MARVGETTPNEAILELGPSGATVLSWTVVRPLVPGGAPPGRADCAACLPACLSACLPTQRGSWRMRTEPAAVGLWHHGGRPSRWRAWSSASCRTTRRPTRPPSGQTPGCGRSRPRLPAPRARQLCPSSRAVLRRSRSWSRSTASRWRTSRSRPGQVRGRAPTPHLAPVLTGLGEALPSCLPAWALGGGSSSSSRGGAGGAEHRLTAQSSLQTRMSSRRTGSRSRASSTSARPGCVSCQALPLPDPAAGPTGGQAGADRLGARSCPEKNSNIYAFPLPWVPILDVGTMKVTSIVSSHDGRPLPPQITQANDCAPSPAPLGWNVAGVFSCAPHPSSCRCTRPVSALLRCACLLRAAVPDLREREPACAPADAHDLFKGKFRTDIKPLDITQPEGPSFEVRGGTTITGCACLAQPALHRSQHSCRCLACPAGSLCTPCS